jgi:DNA invertase Pin-like site-specific DNA recombinase
MSDKVQPHHQARLAIVYVRQSSPEQVKDHPESYRVQKRLVARAAELGWPKEKIRVVQSDLGVSASEPGKRDGFNDVLQLVQDKQVGMVLGQDASRLARNSLDWSLMTHWCALHGALLGDQHQVLDPALPQDSLVLGIQGVLAVHELHTIRERLETALREKASRGELQKGAPRGYVVVDRRHLRKHPDRRACNKLSIECSRSSPRALAQVAYWLGCGRRGTNFPNPNAGATTRSTKWWMPTTPAWSICCKTRSTQACTSIRVYGERQSCWLMVEW